MTTDRYRFDQYDSVYEFNEKADAYVFIGKLNGICQKRFIEEYEDSLDIQEELQS